jgi:hypothetical protein
MPKGKEYCTGCRQSKYDTRLYRFVGQARAVVRFCRVCASKRSDIEVAVQQKVPGK